MNFEVWPEAIELGRMFAAEGYELALVGGPVRDLLLHRKSHDLDFCTSARPEQFEHILRRFGHDGFWDMGRKFGTLGAMRRREDGTEVKVEVTTYRSDTYDPDSRKPEVNYGDTLEGAAISPSTRWRCVFRNSNSSIRSAVRTIWPKACCVPPSIRGSRSTTIRCA